MSGDVQKVQITNEVSIGNFWSGGLNTVFILAGLTAFGTMADKLHDKNVRDNTNSSLILVDPLTQKLDTIKLNGGTFTGENGWVSYKDEETQQTVKYPPNRIYKLIETEAKKPSP